VEVEEEEKVKVGKKVSKWLVKGERVKGLLREK